MVLKFCSVFTLFMLGASAWAQSPSTGTLRGQVADPSGAMVANAAVAVLQSGGPTHSATTNRNGDYEIANLPPGKYTVTANAKGFTVFVQNDVEVKAGQTAQFNISLEIQVEQQKINVEEEGPQVDVNPANNASAIVLKGKDLEALPDDPDELLVGSSGSRRSLRPGPTVARSTLTDLLPASFRRSRPFGRFASIPIRFRPSMTSSAMDESKSSPSPAPTNFTASSRSRATALD